jgi:hypothetical protein
MQTKTYSEWRAGDRVKSNDDGLRLAAWPAARAMSRQFYLRLRQMSTCDFSQLTEAERIANAREPQYFHARPVSADGERTHDRKTDSCGWFAAMRAFVHGWGHRHTQTRHAHAGGANGGRD